MMAPGLLVLAIFLLFKRPLLISKAIFVCGAAAKALLLQGSLVLQVGLTALWPWSACEKRQGPRRGRLKGPQWQEE